jgi:hypothetical protein
MLCGSDVNSVAYICKNVHVDSLYDRKVEGMNVGWLQ